MTKNKKLPLRMCLSCKAMKPKKEMIRIVLAEDKKTYVDVTGKQNGRGAYICDDIKCFNKAKKSSAIERALSTTFDETVYTDLEGYINRNG